MAEPGTLQRVVFVGVATLDAIAAVPRFPQRDERLVSDLVAHAGGGPAATAAVACHRLGVPASFVGAVGDDLLGEAILDSLRREGVHVSGVVRCPGRSGSSVVLVNQTEGTRAICNQPGPALTLTPEMAGAALIREAAWVHADQAGWAAARRFAAGCLSVDGGNPIPCFTPAGVDLFVPTRDRLAEMFGPACPALLLRAALDAGPACVVATDGARGALAAVSGEAWSVPAFLPETAVSTLGAGDVFHGALLAALVHGLDLPRRVAYANIAAALSCRGLDGRSAIPSHAEVMALLSSLHPVRMELP